MRKVLVFGAFDVIHPGHINFLKQAREQGDYLVVSIARDSYIVEWKGKVPIHSEQVRLQYVLETGLVNEAILGDEVPGTYRLLSAIKPDVVCLGYDQETFKENITSWLEDNLPETKVVTLDPYRPDLYKSSKLNASAYQSGEKERDGE